MQHWSSLQTATVVAQQVRPASALPGVTAAQAKVTVVIQQTTATLSASQISVYALVEQFRSAVMVAAAKQIHRARYA